MNIYIVRHGQTQVNAEHRVQGRKGKPLNDVGIKQAEELQKKFEKEGVQFDYVYSSPQERAVQTAEIVSQKKAIIDNRLNVYDLGTADGMLVSEVKTTGVVPDLNIYEGVEDLLEYKKRIFNFMDEIIEKYKNRELNILIAGHKCTTGMISAYFEKFEVNNIYDDFLKLASQNGEYKKYTI